MTFVRMFVVLLVGAVGFVVTAAVNHVAATADQKNSVREFRTRPPHHVAKHAGGLTLRWAMVHDVIHERFPRHGPAYYEHRNRRARELLADPARNTGPDGKPTDQHWRLVDDLGAGLAYLGKFDEATSLLRDKLARQRAAGVTGPSLYGTHANLGTFLVIDGILRSIDRRLGAKELMTEGLGHVRESIRIRPDAHFGREQWQVVVVEHLIAAHDNPELLTKFDMLGNRLDGDPRGTELTEQHLHRLPEFPIGEPTAEERKRIRGAIRPFRPADEWAKAVGWAHQHEYAFDEPVLGILGMWMLGAGANPHFAVALGEVMIRVGQPHIAWAAYERAVRTADAFLKDDRIRSAFVERCRARQKLLTDGDWTEAERPHHSQVRAPKTAPRKPVVEAEARRQFEAELAFGQAWQAKQAKFEAERLAAGADVDGADLLAEFIAKEGPVATPIGDEEFVRVSRHVEVPIVARGLPPMAVLVGGLCAFATAIAFRTAESKRPTARTLAAAPETTSDKPVKPVV